jgi:hypothetical protein
MNLPRFEDAVIPRRKITDYLLSDTHPRGRHKARVFRALGFSVGEWEVLADALLDHAATNDVVTVEPTALGDRFVVDGIMETPSGRLPMLRSVWFIESGEFIPRFVTAFPRRGGGS